jgi:hypothetical protein
MSFKRSTAFGILAPLMFGGCGFFVPEKDVLEGDAYVVGQASPQGKFENTIVAHVRCEIRNGLLQALTLPNVQWLRTWGASVNLKIVVQEQGGVNPGLSLLSPFENSVRSFPTGGAVTSPQSFNFGLGLSGTSNATRTETIAFTYSFSELASEGSSKCNSYQQGVFIESDLKIAQFIYDKAVVAGAAGEASSAKTQWPPYTTFQDEVTFVASYGGNITPTWKFAKISVNSANASLLSATRTKTNDLIITIGKVSPATANGPAQLASQSSQSVHDSALTGSATAASINSQSH